ncbi:immunoglobulin-like domain-containing protein [uncultured Dysgonomonas sp.]|uniref:Bacterial Ig-like domain-containing protein n=1 Tax=uncultured Dysgonomonas sp. TaxID=206096 RepID=A0A212K739_9BACT|nr:immunoglobulin-like domain-containing protein [uncultured Dysgonomonas sp.]SBW07534.1 exported hypothetical protein [uncultured Dysgonomonas sp.]
MKKIILNLTPAIFFLSILLLSGNSCNRAAQKERGEGGEAVSSVTHIPFTMVVLPDTYTLGDEKIHGLITNNTDNEATFGERNSFEYYKNNSWSEVRFSSENALVIHDIAYLLQPHKDAGFDAYLWNEFFDYIPGKYRIKKEITTILTAEFTITQADSINANINTLHSDGDFTMTVSPAACNSNTDSLTVIIINNSQMEIAPLNHYYIERYGEMGWERCYYPSYTKFLWTTHTLSNNASKTYKIPLFTPENIQIFNPGRYRLCKYAEITLSAEFNISD